MWAGTARPRWQTLVTSTPSPMITLRTDSPRTFLAVGQRDGTDTVNLTSLDLFELSPTKRG
jgi:hypothetical protein